MLTYIRTLLPRRAVLISSPVSVTSKKSCQTTSTRTTTTIITSSDVDIQSVDNVVDFLREQNIFDICCMKLPIEMKYANYFVIGSGQSSRHCRATASQLYKLYKSQYTGPQHLLPQLEGIGKATDWVVFDGGNVVVHLFKPETRVKYDLESLWGIGAKFDLHLHNQTNSVMSSSGFDWDKIVAEVTLQKANASEKT